MPSNTVVQVYNQLIGPQHRVARGSIGIEFAAQPESRYRSCLRRWRDRLERRIR